MSATIQYPPGYLEEDHGPRALVACTVILVIATILFPLRIYARNLAPGQRSWDDHLLVPAYGLLLGLIASVYCEVLQAGLGRHAAAVMMEDPNMITKYLKLLYILDWFYVPSNMLSRVSVVCMYLRIFTDKWARVACWTVIAFLVANCVATIIAAQLECTPIAYIWDKSIEGGQCFNQMLWYQITNIPNIVGDVMIAILPIKTIWTIQASIARKAGICWLCGKPGIGKSILTRYSGATPTRRPFPLIGRGELSGSDCSGLAGSGFLEARIRKQTMGCGLLYYILRADPSLTQGLLPAMWTEARTGEAGRLSLHTTAEMRDAFHTLSAAPITRKRFCFFIDGLA